MDRGDLSAEILLIAAAVSHCAEEERQLLQTLCAAAEQEAEASLREGVSPKDCAGAYVCACAWMAAASLELSRGGEEFSSLRAGDMSLTLKGTGERRSRAALLREDARAMLAPYAGDGTFFFRGVKG